MSTIARPRTRYGPPAPVPIYQHEQEFSRLLDLYRARKPFRVLEVGTYYGGTLYHWLQNAVVGATVVSVDSYAVGVDNRHLYPRWCPDGVTVVAVAGNSHDQETVDQVAEHGPYDWVWIDAGHYYREVKRDWELYGPMCADRGVVCFHDILPPSRQHPEIEVNRLWKQLKKQYRTEEIVHDPDAAWGGIGVIYP